MNTNEFGTLRPEASCCIKVLETAYHFPVITQRPSCIRQNEDYGVQRYTQHNILMLMMLILC